MKDEQLKRSFEASRALNSFHPAGRIAVAVSGGSDSMALLRLLSRWSLDRKIKLAAVSVDHGLRRAAAAECEMAGRLARSLGHAHTTLHWTPAAGGNLQNEARRARYRLIADWAKKDGCGAVALGHTMDDQAETVVLNLARGSGVDGLSAMPAGIVRNGIRWLRPLLDIRRAALREFLRGAGISWAEDPSNDDLRFDRVRARRLIAELAPLGLSVERLAATADRMQAAREVLAQTAERAAQNCGHLTELGEVGFGAGFWSLPKELRLRLAADALRTVNGNEYRPRLKPLISALDRCRDAAATLAGCIMREADGFSLLIMREPAACGPPVPASGSWDNRWRLAGQPAPPGATIAALGETGLAKLPESAAVRVSRERLLASPSLWEKNRLLAAPFAGFGAGWSFRLAPSGPVGVQFAPRH